MRKWASAVFFKPRRADHHIVFLVLLVELLHKCFRQPFDIVSVSKPRRCFAKSFCFVYLIPVHKSLPFFRNRAVFFSDFPHEVVKGTAFAFDERHRLASAVEIPLYRDIREYFSYRVKYWRWFLLIPLGIRPRIANIKAIGRQ